MPPFCCLSFESHDTSSAQCSVSAPQFIWHKWLAVMKLLYCVQTHWNDLDIHLGVILIGNIFSPHKWCSNFDDCLCILVPTSLWAFVTQPCVTARLSLGKLSHTICFLYATISSTEIAVWSKSESEPLLFRVYKKYFLSAHLQKDSWQKLRSVKSKMLFSFHWKSFLRCAL